MFEERNRQYLQKESPKRIALYREQFGYQNWPFASRPPYGYPFSVCLSPNSSQTPRQILIKISEHQDTISLSAYF
jgi:hypothetical protein